MTAYITILNISLLAKLPIIYLAERFVTCAPVVQYRAVDDKNLTAVLRIYGQVHFVIKPRLLGNNGTKEIPNETLAVKTVSITRSTAKEKTNKHHLISPKNNAIFEFNKNYIYSQQKHILSTLRIEKAYSISSTHEFSCSAYFQTDSSL